MCVSTSGAHAGRNTAVESLLAKGCVSGWMHSAPARHEHEAKRNANVHCDKLIYTSLTGQTILWESKNPEIATVDSNGTVFRLSLGETVVIATIDGTDYEYRIKVK